MCRRVREGSADETTALLAFPFCFHSCHRREVSWPHHTPRGDDPRRIFAKYSWNDHPDTVLHSLDTVMPGQITSDALASNHDTPIRRRKATLSLFFFRFLRFLALAEGPTPARAIPLAIGRFIRHQSIYCQLARQCWRTPAHHLCRLSLGQVYIAWAKVGATRAREHVCKVHRLRAVDGT